MHPAWIYDAMMELLAQSETIKDGILHHNDLPRIWQFIPSEFYPAVLEIAYKLQLTDKIPISQSSPTLSAQVGSIKSYSIR